MTQLVQVIGNKLKIESYFTLSFVLARLQISVTLLGNLLLCSKLVKEILKRCATQLLVTLYKIPRFESVDDFLYKVATVRGKLKKGGIVDIEAAARIVLHDWNEGAVIFF